MPPSYYTHPTGKVGVSLDDGSTIILPNGRLVERDAPVWVEPEEDLYESLTPEQRVAIAPVLEAEETIRRERDAQRKEHEALSELADEFNLERATRQAQSKPLGSGSIG